MLAPNCRNKLCIWCNSCRKIFRAKMVSPPQTVLESYAHGYLHRIFIVFRCYKAMFVCIYVHSAVAPIVFQPLPKTDF